MTTSSPSSLPRRRQFLAELCHTARHLGATLNWRRDPGYEERKRQHEWRMKQLENEILRVRNDRERIEKEIEQLRQENAKGRQLLAKIDALCFPPEFSWTPPNPIEPGSRPSSP